MKLGFIGTGVITEAIVTGLLNSDFPITEMILSERNKATSSRLAAASPLVHVCKSNQEIVDRSDVVFLAVRPQDAEPVLRPLRFRHEQDVASLIATLTAETLHDWIGPGVRIFRAIPLPSVANKRGVTAIFPDCTLGQQLFGNLGTVVTAKSLTQFDAYATTSALMGTYFGILDTATQWLCDQGTDYDSAQAYLNGVFLGLAKTSTDAQGTSFATLREEHSTPKGLNEQMFDEFASQGGTQALADALQSVLDRVRAARPSKGATPGTTET